MIGDPERYKEPGEHQKQEIGKLQPRPSGAVPLRAIRSTDCAKFWDLRIAVADRYQMGRVFIAGDRFTGRRGGRVYPRFGGCAA